MSKVFFHYADRKLNIPNKRNIQQFVEQIFKKEKKQLNHIDYIFCSDDYLLNININHLQHDYYTDIITFELSSTNKTEAEIYISLDRVKENAQQLNEPFNKEVLRVIFHGALHLCGYKDKTKKDAELMRQMENRYLAFYLK
ncbi:rRNA maturation RNase YbeY [Arachidicoccus ginsenosidimutans]|uniref:rRNA maturation RNase YbeY n=1 Tax=Arachidicoccus sp. BS20 TaxID=1850526 RepID=UPI0007F0FB59|nr:rRNA maturation RNase YbeY [Arachidicoccus sp. BS20]ANI89931.1 rRNA maturation RNase YbeY [Arachidicoccus sp. BS20]